jgi:hypothetical protein
LGYHYVTDEEEDFSLAIEESKKRIRNSDDTKVRTLKKNSTEDDDDEVDFEGPSGRKRPAKITYKKKDMYFLEIYADKLQNKLIGVCVMADGDSRYISNVEKIVYPGYFGNNSWLTGGPAPATSKLHANCRSFFVGSIFNNYFGWTQTKKLSESQRYEKLYGKDRASVVKFPSIRLEHRVGKEVDEPLPFGWGQTSPPKFKHNILLHFDKFNYGEK